MARNQEPEISEADSERSKNRQDTRSRRRRVPNFVVVPVLLGNFLLVAILFSSFGHSTTGSEGTINSGVFVLPPSDARDVFLGRDSTQAGFNAYEFFYTSPEGEALTLTLRWYDKVTAPNLPTTQSLGLPPGTPFREITVDGLTRSVATCMGTGSMEMTGPTQPTVPLGSFLIGDGPMILSPPMGGSGFLADSLVVLRFSLSRECVIDDAHAVAIERAMQGLRYVNYSEFYAYAATKPTLSFSVTEPVLPPEPFHFDGEERARAQVTEAINGLDLRLPDGSYPNIEGGAAPNDYDVMFDGAREASGATPGAKFASAEIRFRSEIEAIATFKITAQFATGPETFTQTGSVVRVGDRWVVSRSTVMQMLGRSSLPH